MTLTDRTRRESELIRKHFLVLLTLDDEAKPLRDRSATLPKGFRFIADTFLDRLTATIQTTAAPFVLASAAAHEKRFQLFVAAERIRGLKRQAEPGDEEEAARAKREAVAIETARSKMDEYRRSDEGFDALVYETARFLRHLEAAGSIQSVARELLLQGTVSIWSALEMLIVDSLEMLLDCLPNLASKLLSDPTARKRFELPKLNIEDLTTRGFDLSKQMGHLVFHERDLSNLPTLKCACDALFDVQELRDQLASPELWRLNQDRHLIVHRRGIVDEDYLRKTGSTLIVGQQLVIAPDVFEQQIFNVLRVGDAFVTGLVRTLKGP